MKNVKQSIGGTIAFTLVELIVVIAILLVLGTISFLAYQSFSKEARDSKRVSDTRNLLNKVSILEVKGTSLNDLISSYEDGENIKENSLTFNAQSGKIGYQGKVNFDKIDEVEENFQDPKAKVNYPFAVSKGTLERSGKTESYSFQQIAYVSEINGKTKLVGNYFKYQDGDSPSLFVSDGTIGENIPGDYYVNDDEEQIYDFEEKDPPTTCPGGYYLPEGRKKCTAVGKGYYRAETDPISQRTACEGNKTTLTTTSTSISDCSECIEGYTGPNCETEIPKTCAPEPDYPNAIFTPGTPTSINQARTKGATDCGFTCKLGYTGSTCNEIDTWTDPTTGFVWERYPSTAYIAWAANDSYAEPTWDSTTKTYSSTSGDVNSTNYPAFARCTGLGTGWRLPTKNELRTLVTYTHPGLTTSHYYCSVTEYVTYPTGIWAMDYAKGIFNRLKTYTYLVVCIYDDSVTATGLGRITNPNVSASTRLGTAVTYAGISAYKDSYLDDKYWQASPDTTFRNWNATNTYCAGLGEGGWRLPTMEELYSLITYTAKNSNGAYSVHPAVVAPTNAVYQTSTASTEHAWNVSFRNGGTYGFSKATTGLVVCIHD